MEASAQSEQATLPKDPGSGTVQNIHQSLSPRSTPESLSHVVGGRGPLHKVPYICGVEDPGHKIVTRLFVTPDCDRLRSNKVQRNPEQHEEGGGAAPIQALPKVSVANCPLGTFSCQLGDKVRRKLGRVSSI